MPLILYEMKKMFFYQKGLLLIGLFFVLSAAALMIFDTPNNPDVEMNLPQYSYYLKQVAGPYSDETEQFFTNESKRISDAHVALQKAYDDYYDGNISEEELLAVTSPLEEIVKHESGFQLIFDQYTYIRENPDNRYFLSTNGWDGLLSTDSLDLLFLLLLLVLVTPVFCSEYVSEMDSLHLTVKKGTRVHAVTKIILVLMTVIVLCLLTSLLRYGFFQVKYGLENGNYPLQSLAYFGASSKDSTLFSAFLSLTGIKIFGNLSFAMLMMLISVWTKKYALTLFSSTAVILLPYYGFSIESSKYFLPGPLGFMISTGFFRGNEYEYNIFTDQMDITFEEISMMTMLSLFIVTLGTCIGAFIVIIVRHTNVWSARKRRYWGKSLSMMVVLCLAVSSLVGCASNEKAEKADIYNSVSRLSYENEHYRFYLDQTDLDDRLVFEDKQTGEINNLVRTPMQSLTNVEPVIYGNGPFVYYMKFDNEKSGYYEEMDRFSVIEVETTTFDEKIVYEKNVNSAKDSFLGLHTVDIDDTTSFLGIESFFLDETSIYFVGDQQIKRINRRTGKTNVIIRSPFLSANVAYDGNNIYYLNEKYQVVEYDTQTGSETIIPDLITTYFVVTDTELLYVNRQDQHKIYAMNLDNSTIEKIVDKPVWSFTCDDQYIYYQGKYDNKSYRVDRDGENDTLLEDEND
ncbi:protein of unknown function [Evansella caseinilytica]|uniref:Prolow-density lipoprotein receptor-related protein 1-like beta-propeller domain-containing protein n=1 Tax=Evansella caseinilytica TaxID=1503961 RepID=A0A1H3V0W7_9BACI|nr:DUF5050 domain-containing protein [Evansella caseinilytica]SDZ68353.1 protein of unknown function [Evansella caseinilytica]